MKNIKEQLEEAVRKHLPEEKISKYENNDEIIEVYPKEYADGFNQALSQIKTSLIADEVLKVVVEKIQEYKMYYNTIGDDINKGRRLACDDIINYLSPNKENKNND